MKILKALFISVSILLTSSAFAQTTPAATPAPAVATVKAPPTYIEAFFKAYDKQGTAKAVKDIFKSNKLIDSTNLVGLITKMDSARNNLGQYTGKDLIMQRKASNSLILYSYLVKHEFDAIRLTFVFYKPKNEWVIYRLYFDNQVMDELQNSSVITGKP